MKFAILALGAAVSVVGCSSEGTKSQPEISAVQGALVATTFPDAPTAVQATDESGATVETKLGDAASFHLALRRGHTYRLNVVSTTSSKVPIVFPRATGKLEDSFRISGGGAVVTLGSVRYLPSAPADGFAMKSAAPAKTLSLGSGDGAGGVCVDGMLAGTSQVCVDDDAQAVCGDTQADGECENGIDQTTGAACTDPPEQSDVSSADGECEDGVDQTTGAACTDPPDGSGPMAVPDHNAPADVGGCDSQDDGEEADD